MTSEQEKVRSLLIDTITLLCKNGLSFSNEIKVQGLLAVTIDSKDFFVVQIDENLSENFTDENIDSVDVDFGSTSSITPIHIPNEVSVVIPRRKRARILAADKLYDSKKKVTLMACESEIPSSDPNGLKNLSDVFPFVSSSSRAVKVEDDEDDVLLVESSDNSHPMYNNAASGGHLGFESDVRKNPMKKVVNSGKIQMKQKKRRMENWNYDMQTSWAAEQTASNAYGLENVQDEQFAMTGQDAFQDSTDLCYDQEELDIKPEGEKYEGEKDDLTINQSCSGEYVCQYNDCGQLFKHKFSRDRHQRKVHGCVFGKESAATYFCRISGCPNVFCSQVALYKHRGKFHGLNYC